MALHDEPGLTFAARQLDPGTRMGELLFGLIMTLSFTLGAGVLVSEDGQEGARQLLMATAGCNLAWGLIDGVFYVLSQLFERSRRNRVARRVSQAASPTEARELVALEFDETLKPITEPAQRQAVYDTLVHRLRTTQLPPTRLRKSDLLGALASAWLVFACSFPAALPFAVFDDPALALRISNAILLALLFVVGYRAARRTLARPWIVGASFVAVGLALVLVSISLGG
jgi:VIT1/CCC1 family predicted Fe2+/Mn2+ transporter